MAPNKILWLMGYGNLSLVLEQERKHWLLKTDKKKQIQDKVTGDMFLGQIDNIGSDVVLSAEKLPITNNVIQTIAFQNQAAADILEPATAAFAYSSSVNGLLFERIISTNFPLTIGTSTTYNHYKLKLTNCSTVIIPFGGSLNTDHVYAGRWLRTTTTPSILLPDSNGEYTIERTLEFTSTTSDAVYYYPLEASLQPLGITDLGGGTFTVDAVNDDGYIGYPLYWFTCAQSNIGPTMSFSNNVTNTQEQLLYIGNAGNASKYCAYLYTGIAGTSNNGTPDGTSTTNYKIRCTPSGTATFSNISSDKNIPLSSTITFLNTSDQSTTVVVATGGAITMGTTAGWAYVDANTYEINMNLFDENCLSNPTRSELSPLFSVHFDEAIPFDQTTTDIGFAGIRVGTSNATSDVYGRYPYDLNTWDGLPVWMNDLDENAVPQHLAIYAIHNTPTYTPEVPDSRQVAALLLDPGIAKTTNDEGYTNEERGRVYVLSNDGVSYENNGSSANPKPARTVARICDIPTSVMQLSNVSGLAPTSIVDKKYTRTQASYKLVDKQRLYNTMGTRWVLPTALDAAGTAITAHASQTNNFVFERVSFLEEVDMVNHNDFRIKENLNPMVDPRDVALSSITAAGSGYAVDDFGVVVVGGFAFHYTVAAVDETGGVTALAITPASDAMINLSNFDMTVGDSGITEVYGSSPLIGTGTGLRFRFLIQNYQSILPYSGENFDGLYAFVKESDGLWLYTYIIDSVSTMVPKDGTWTKQFCVSLFEESTSELVNGGLSSSEAYINSVVPTLQTVSVSRTTQHADPVTMQCFKTASTLNIVDGTKTPISNNANAELTSVDMCKFYCDGLSRARVPAQKTADAVMTFLRQNGLLWFDSYVIWKWESTTDSTNRWFQYGIIHRSINNYMSSDFKTTLPVNGLRYSRYVHVNANTSITWAVPEVGNMLWVYNPSSQTHEAYTVNPDTRDLSITRTSMTWADVDVRDTVTGSSVVLVADGKLVFNIVTNNPSQVSQYDPTMTNPDPIYQQPEFYQLPDLVAGTLVSSITPAHNPMGNWELVFPRVDTFKFVNVSDGRQYTPTKLQVLKNRTMTTGETIVDSYGHNVNAKTLLMNETDGGIVLKAYNTQTGQWESI